MRTWRDCIATHVVFIAWGTVAGTGRDRAIPCFGLLKSADEFNYLRESF